MKKNYGASCFVSPLRVICQPNNMFPFEILSFWSRRYGTTIRDMKRKSRRLFLLWRIGFVISWNCIRIPLFTISVNIRAISGTDTYGWAGSAVLRLRRASR